MYYVKVEGKSLVDLKHGLERHLKELSCYGSNESAVNVEVNFKPSVPVRDSLLPEEEMEEVESPFKVVTPEYGVGPVPSVSEVKAEIKNTVVDNETDAEGIPWDDRIHASSKAKVGNGTWRTKRGCDENLLYQVKNELRARVQTAVVQTTTPTYVAPAAIVAPVSHPIAESLKPVEVPVAQAPVAAAPLPLMQSSGHSLDTFKSNFPLIVSTLITEKKINQDYVNQLKSYFNIAEIWMANDEQKAQVFEQFVQYGFVQKVG